MGDSTAKTTFHCIAARVFISAWLSISAVACLTMPALADDGRARYVSGSGQDTGDCLNRFRPCRTLSYAIARAGKSDALWVAEGEYAVRNTEQLLQLTSITGRVRAGYDKHTGFVDRTASGRTVLIGVPPAMRERFEAAGFSVIVDTKSFASIASPDEARDMRTFAAKVAATEKSQPATPCVGGIAANFPCQAVSLLSHTALGQLQPASSRGADLWGFTDLNNGREYVVYGLDNGVAVVDITNPDAPVQIAYANGNNTTWREVTIYQRYDATAKRWRAYAYVTVDGSVPDQLIVLDLSNLPNSVEQVNYASDVGPSHTDYLVNADYTYGIQESSAGAQLVISGARSSNGGNFRLYSLANPRAPQFISQGNRGYAHDVASFGVADARKSQCPNAGAAAKCLVLTDFNEGTIDTWDVTNPAAPAPLGRVSYSNAAYVHSGWWTEDGSHLFVHDELDEQTFGLGAIVRIFDMSNLALPSMVASWNGPNRAIDHNGYVKGNRYYFSHYSEGLTVLDITNPRMPQRVGSFDTFPASAQTAFVGAWGAYPFFASGAIAIADINSGLYLLRNETLAVPQGTLSFAAASVNASEGNSATVAVRRMGGSTGAVSVQLDLLHGTTDASDLTLTTQTLNWADGDAADKSADIAFMADAQTEDMELLLVRLRNPQGGGTINYPDTAQVYVADTGASARLRLLDTNVRVNEVRGRVFLFVTRQGSVSGTATVNFSTVPNPAYTGFTAQQGTLTWGAGDADAKMIAIDFDPNRLQPGQTATFQVELTGASGADLETAAGATAVTTSATITVEDVVPPSAPGGSPGSGRRSGGGAFDLWALLALAGLAGSGGLIRTANRGRLRNGASSRL